MLLKDYLDLRGIEYQEFAKALGTSRTYLYHVFSGRKKLNLKRAREVEILTKGMVTRLEALYPEDFEEETAAGKQLRMSIAPKL